MINEYKAVPDETTFNTETGKYTSWFLLDTFGKKYATMYKEDDAKSIAKMLNERVQEGLLNGY